MIKKSIYPSKIKISIIRPKISYKNIKIYLYLKRIRQKDRNNLRRRIIEWRK